MRVVTAKQMKEIEARAADFDLSPHRLMENAGSAAAAFIRRTFKVAGLNCMVFCGGGNNGGDGYVVARKLSENEANVLLVQVGELPRSEEAMAMYSMIKMLEIPMADFVRNKDRVMELLGQADIIVDALYGTGFRGSLEGEVQEACRAINSAISAVVSLDLPSGVVCDTGVADPHAIRADFTIAFDSSKPVHVIAPGPSYCGRVEVVDIGIPDEAREGILTRIGKLSTDTVLSHLPQRPADSHKGDFGRVLMVCGSPRYRGAATLAAKAAFRCGAGLVTLASTEPVCSAVAGQICEATFLPLPATATGTIDSEGAWPILRDAVKSSSAILFGCGLGSGPHTQILLRHVLATTACPVIVDADGINALSENIDIIQEAKATVILTPHPGEMARLCGRAIDEIQGDRSEIAVEWARSQGVVLVLKGHETLIADPEGGLLKNTTGNSGLAKGGSGDILAGMLAALAAQGVPPVDAAACAVHLHGLAADRTAKRLSQTAMLPSELLDDLTQIFRDAGR